MPFTDRFQLLDLKRDEGARTYEAREIATGRPVFVHVFANRTSPINRALLASVDALSEEERARILDRGELEGGVYLVTDRLAEYGGLREWLKAKHESRVKALETAGAWQLKPPPAVDPAPLAPLMNSGEQTAQLPAPPAAPSGSEVEEVTLQVEVTPPSEEAAKSPPILRPTPAETPSSSEPGEFTRQFATPVLRPAPTPPPAPPASEPGEFTRQFAPPVLRPTPPPPTPSKEPGEFTRLFAAPSPTPKPAAPAGEFTRQFQAPQRPPAAPPQRVPPVSPSSPPPGEFTQMLQAQRPSAPAPKQPPESSEFTQYFQSPASPPSQREPLTTPQPPSPPKGAGEFTQIFGRGDLPSPPPPPAPAAPPRPSSANATQVFATPRPTAPPQASPQGPGEYTQMFAKQAPLTFGQAPPPISRAPIPEPNKRNNSRLPLLLVLGAVVLLVIALAVFFVMRQHST